MYKKLKLFTSAALAAVILLNCVGCNSDKKSNSELPNTKENVETGEMIVSAVNSESSAASVNNADTDLLGNSPPELVLKNSDADGYTICKIDGSEDYQLVLLYGEYEKECQFEFYTVGEDNIENIGSLDGSNITAYISDETKCFCICLNNSENFEFGAVKYDGEGINVDWLETVTMGDKDDFPDIPGEKVVFMPTNNPELINSLKDKLPDNADEETVEVEE